MLDRAIYCALPLGSVRPLGWLRDQLQLQADGFTGHLGEVWPDVGLNSAWLGGSGEDWERGPYYCDGLIPLAHLLGDQKLIEQAQRWVDWALSSQRPDGSFGPTSRDDWWPRMVMLKVLTQHADATGDVRVVPFMLRYAAHQLAEMPNRPLSAWGQARGAENILSLHWLYEKTQDTSLEQLIGIIERQTLDWTGHFTVFPCKDRVTSFNHLTHVVNVAMAIKEPALRYLRTGDEAFREAVYTGLAQLDKWHGQPQGMFSGDEWLAGTNPTQGVELCAVVELAYSLEHLIRLFGDVAHSDRLERVMYNALPATISADMRGRQYDQQPNQVLCSVAKRDWTLNKDDSNIFGLEPNFGCCTANLHQGWPKFAASLWMATGDGGLVMAAYGPSIVETIIDGHCISIIETTEYPFEGAIRLDVTTDGPVEFPLIARVPEWCERPDIRVNGERMASSLEPGFHEIRRVWSTGDVVEIDVPASISLRDRPSGGVVIEQGPLIFALRVGEDWRAIGRSPPFQDWEIHPTTAWNYAVAIDTEDPGASFTRERQPIGRMPFSGEAPPIVLHGQGRLMPEWKMEGNSAGPVPTGATPNDMPLEPIELIPYGCARLRVTELPLTTT